MIPQLINNVVQKKSGYKWWVNTEYTAGEIGFEGIRGNITIKNVVCRFQDKKVAGQSEKEVDTHGGTLIPWLV